MFARTLVATLLPSSFASSASSWTTTGLRTAFTTVETSGRVGVVRLNRPPLNPLSDEVYDELVEQLQKLDLDPEIGAILLTGNDRAFAAGADIKYMAPLTGIENYNRRMLMSPRLLDRVRTPIVGVVKGYALGGGCELAMQCDILFAGESAKFGQPEIKLGTIPGAGGTQRLIRAIGKSRAMQLILTGEMITAQQASDWGLVSSVHPDAEVFDVGLKAAQQIASFSKPIASLAKDAVNMANEIGLETGLDYERRVFELTFSTADKMEGMSAFVAKKTPTWQHK